MKQDIFPPAIEVYCAIGAGVLAILIAFLLAWLLTAISRRVFKTN